MLLHFHLLFKVMLPQVMCIFSDLGWPRLAPSHSPNWVGRSCPYTPRTKTGPVSKPVFFFKYKKTDNVHTVNTPLLERFTKENLTHQNSKYPEIVDNF